jgi:ABC-type antimicrobial peptide transport system permease subunit
MVLVHTGRLIALGLLVGIVAAALVGRALASMLFGVGTWDPPTLAMSALALTAVGLTAAWLPARRAVRADPREALRTE